MNSLLQRTAIAIFAILTYSVPHAAENIFAKGALTPYTEEQLRAFYALRMQHVVEGGLLIGKNPVPQINSHYAELMAMIKKRYGKFPTFTLSPSYNESSRRIMAGSSVMSGIPTVSIVVPAQWDYYVALQGTRSPNATAMFENALVIAVLHELDHLAYGLLGFGQRSLSPELDVVEAYTWAHTCEDTIRIFVEKGLPLTDNNRMYYQAWVSAGRHADSEQWQQFIHGDHALARKQP